MKDFQEIYELYVGDVYHYLYKLSGNRHVAEELTQETFYKAILNSGKYDGSENIKPWLITIAKNCFYSLMRKKEKQNISLDEWMEVEPQVIHSDKDEYDRVIESQELIEIHKILHTINEPYKEVFSLRVFGELSFKEIGEIFDKSENWAKVTYFRAKNQIVEKIHREVE